jgi:hypothetical protein
MSGNPVDISKRYFCEPIGSSNPLCSASKSLILNEKIYSPELRRNFRRLATEVAGVGHCESKFFAIPAATGGVFSECDFASGFLCE